MHKKANISELTKTTGLTEGRIPPQALELEEAVLGAIMLEKDAILRVINYITPECFYKDSHQKIFQAIINLTTTRRPVDLLTVTEELRRMKELEEVGGPLYITQLTTRIASAAHIEYHSKIVAQKFIQREQIRISTEVINRAYSDEDPEEVWAAADLQYRKLTSVNQAENAESIGVIGAEVLRKAELARSKNNIPGIPTGLHKLDMLIGGYQEPDLIIVAARPGVGKTSFAVNSLIHASQNNIPVVLFSQEMNKISIGQRSLSNIVDISTARLRNGDLAEQEWEILDNLGMRKLESMQFYVDDTAALTINQLRAKVLRLIKKHKIKLIAVDYLQLMAGVNKKSEIREQEVSGISRGLKALCKETATPIIALSQLNRDAEGIRPSLAHLRESGAIEQDADIVIFLNRPDKNSSKIEVIVAKHRNGPVGLVECYTNKFCTRFADQDEFTNNNVPY